MLRRIIISIVAIVVLLAIGLVGAKRLIDTAPKPPTKETTNPALLVRVVELEPQHVTEPIVGYGTAAADRAATLAAQVSGAIVEIHRDLRVGTAVQAGELLLRIDEREYQRKLDRARGLLAAGRAQRDELEVEEQNTRRLQEIAETELEIAEREYVRVKELFEVQRATLREIDLARSAFEVARRTRQTLQNRIALLPKQHAAAEAAIDQQEAAVAMAELELERCRITAPFDGRLSAVHVEFGERVNIGAPLVAVLDPSLIEIPIELPVSKRESVLTGGACKLRLESDPRVAWSGQIARIAPNADQGTRTFALYVEVDNDAQDVPLMPGVFVRAEIDGPTIENALLVPRGVIQDERVYIYEDGKARRVPIEVRQRLRDQAVIAGVAPHARVITTNLDALWDGAAVRVEAEHAAATAGAAEQPAPGTTAGAAESNVSKAARGS